MTQDLAGMRHYITDAALIATNTFVRDRSDYIGDNSPPIWTSTFNDNLGGSVPGPATPRVGIQQVVNVAAGQVIVRWDVALDKNAVFYRLYYQTAPFDFSGDPNLSRATVLDLLPISRVPQNYINGQAANVYAFEATVSGLQSGVRHYFCIRAYDDAPLGSNEEKNTVSRSIIVQ